MSMSISSTSDASSTIQSLLQSLGNVAGNAAGVGPVGDWLGSIGNSASSATAGSGQAAAQSFGVSPPPFQNGTMAALIALQSQDGQAAAGANGAAGAQDLLTAPDGSGDGSLDPGELIEAARRAHGRHRHHGPMQQPDASTSSASLIDQLAKTQAQLSPPPAATVSAVA